MNLAGHTHSRRLAAMLGFAALLAVGPVAPIGDAAAQRVKRDDAYRPTENSPGLGVLNGDGSAAPAPAYGAPAPYAAPGGYAAPGTEVERAPLPPPNYAGGPSGYGAPPPYIPPYESRYGQAAPPPRNGYGPAPAYEPPPPAYGAPRAAANDAYRPSAPGGYAANDAFGQPYSPPSAYGAGRPYMSGETPPPYREGGYRGEAQRGDGTFSADEITRAGHGFFGSISQGLASVIEHAFRSKGRPNGYILGEDAGGAFIAGLRYGQGQLHTKDAGSHPVYWQGPSIGFDYGAEGSKVMILVYNLRDVGDIYHRYGGVAGSAYLVGGVGLTFLTKDHVTMAPIRSGVGLRLGANIGYLKFRDRPTWNPF